MVRTKPFRNVTAAAAHHLQSRMGRTALCDTYSAPSQAVCLRLSTREPVPCARNEGADIENISTTGRILAQCFVMRGDFFDTRAVSFGLCATSPHCFPCLSPRNSNSAKRLTMALQLTAPAVTVAAILIRASLVRATFFRSSYAPPSLHLRSYRAALRSR